jgi:hypothetical protein
MPLLAAAPAAAQDPSWGGMRDAGVEVTMMKPSFDDDEFGFATGVLAASARFRLSPSALLVTDLPIARGTLDRPGDTAGSSSTLGNPYVGIELQRPSGWSWATGVRIPIQREFGDDDYATGIGFLTDVNRGEAYVSKVLALSGSVRYDVRSTEGFTARFQLGPIVDVPLGDDSDMEDVELNAAYAAALGYAISRLELSGGWVGRAILSESDLGDGGRSVDQLFGELVLGGGRVQPTLGVRVPLDEGLSDGFGLNSVLTFGVRIR